jgi:TolB-like protein/Tfp pilus assembly protein PilF
VDDALAIFRQICAAVTAAHAKGIVHRDLKPENLIVTPDGRVKILDFGLAGLLPDASGGSASPTATLVTAPGSVMGTAGYMSPEQVRGERVDARSDIFSFGAILYEMLTGERAFAGPTRVDTMHAVLQAEPTQLSAVSGALPPGLRQVVARCLRKAASERYASARELEAVIEMARQPQPTPPQPLRMSGRTRAAVAVAVLGLLAAASVVGLRMRASRPDRGVIRSIAVLPLQDLSRDGTQQYFADGMTDALIGDLSRIRALRVISRTSTQRYKNTKTPLRQVAAELDVDAVVEGSVLWSGERVRVSAQLSDAAEDRTLWAQSYERELADVLALQRELAAAITQEVRVQVTSDERKRLASPAHAVDPVAYERYLQGRYYLSQPGTENTRKAIELFRAAIEQSPGYAPAYAGLSSSYGSLGSVQVGRPSAEMKQLAATAARKALELDAGLAEAHTALGRVQLTTWQWDAAERSLRRAIEADPSLPSARIALSMFFTLFGRVDEALAEARKATALDPFAGRGQEEIGIALLNARRYDEAVLELRRAIEIDPRRAGPRWWLAVAFAEQGRFEESIAEHQRALELLNRSPAFLGTLGNVYARAGRRDRALAIRDELVALSRKDYVTPAAFVFLYTGLGDKDKAFEWLDKAAQDQTNVMQFLRVYPLLDPLRADPRFEAMLRRAGFAN